MTTLWQDANGDLVRVNPDYGILAVESEGGTGLVALPTDPARKRQLVAELAEAMGLPVPYAWSAKHPGDGGLIECAGDPVDAR